MLAGAANNYSGIATISEGELRLDNGSGSATGTGTVSEIKGVVSGAGSETGKFTVTNASVLAAGDNTAGSFGTVDTLGVGKTGGLTLTNAALDYDLSARFNGTNDLISTGGGLNLVTLTFTFNELSGTLDTTNPYTLISGASNVTGFTGGYAASFLNGAAYTLTYTQTARGLQVQFAPLVVAPEPNGLLSFLSGSVVLGGTIIWRRRQGRCLSANAPQAS